MRERGEQLRLMKSLGDGVMLCYSKPAEAVAAVSRIVRAMRDSEDLGVHASIHHGVAVARDGDYFGGVVNLAARLLACARRDEVVATAPVASATESDFEWVSAGVVKIRGFSDPVETFSLVWSDDQAHVIPQR